MSTQNTPKRRKKASYFERFTEEDFDEPEEKERFRRELEEHNKRQKTTTIQQKQKETEIAVEKFNNLQAAMRQFLSHRIDVKQISDTVEVYKNINDILRIMNIVTIKLTQQRREIFRKDTAPAIAHIFNYIEGKEELLQFENHKDPVKRSYYIGRVISEAAEFIPGLKPARNKEDLKLGLKICKENYETYRGRFKDLKEEITQDALLEY